MWIIPQVIDRLVDFRGFSSVSILKLESGSCMIVNWNKCVLLFGQMEKGGKHERSVEEEADKIQKYDQKRRNVYGIK